MGYYTGKDFPEMLADLDTAEKSHGTGGGLIFWVTGFRSHTGNGRDAVRAGVNGLRVDWQDLAGDSFGTRWAMTEPALDAWASWAIPDLTGIREMVQATRAIVLEAQMAYAEQMRQANALTSPDASFTEQAQAGQDGFQQGAAMGMNAAKERAAAAMDKLSDDFAKLGQAIQEQIPDARWNGPTGDAGSVPQTAPGQRPTGTGPGGPGGGPSDLGDTGDQAGGPGEQAGAGDEAGAGGDPAGGDPAGGGVPTEGEGPGLAGLPPGTMTPTTPTTPTYLTGPGGVGKLPTPSIPVIPGGIPLQPLTTTTPKDPKGFKVGSGLGGSGLGGSGLGGSGLGGQGGGGSGLGGIDVGKGIGNDGKDVPGQAARQMSSRALPVTPQAPVPPATTPAGAASAPAAAGTPPPMMPPMGMGGGGESPRPGTAKPVVQNKGRTTNRLPGVPPKLRGRSGKADPTSGLGAFGAAATSATRRRSERTEPLDTVQLLDEELWAVDSKPESSSATPRRKGFSSR